MKYFFCLKFMYAGAKLLENYKMTMTNFRAIFRIYSFRFQKQNAIKY